VQANFSLKLEPTFDVRRSTFDVRRANDEVAGDVISAYQGYQYFQPGLNGYFRYQSGGGQINDETYFPSYPGGHSLIARMFVKKVIPKAFTGEYSIKNLLQESIQWEVLDQPHQPVRMRLSSTVVSVAHDGPSDSAKGVVVHYVRGNKLFRARAKSAILAGQQHVNRHICRDVPADYKQAMGAFHHAPMLDVNVAVTNWKFLDRLGIASARWFEGFGWWLSLRRQILVDGIEPQPLDPAKPTVLTLYNPLPVPGLPLAQQCTAARMKLFGMPYSAIELGVREQFTKMFASAGFDAKRDIAGIVSNRFGHAYVAAPPYFYFGKDGKPAPKEVLRTRFNRLAFAHSELSGYQMWETATDEGIRAAKQILEMA
jgi:spermidine dehydrogenase